MAFRRAILPSLAAVAVAVVCLMGPAGLRAQPAGDGMAARAPGAADVERGSALFRPSCGFCHGAEAGGAQGPALTTSRFFTVDDRGRSLAEFLKVGRPANGMPPFPALPADQVAALHAFVRSRAFERPARAAMAPASILVGNAAAGRAYFEGAGRCSTCHSITGDLKGVGARYNPLILQGKIINPRLGVRGPLARPPRAEVTLPGGKVVAGVLEQVNDFFVTLRDDSGTRRTFPRDNATPRVKINDPAEAHRTMMLTWTDAHMHDVTAYLASLK